MRAWELVRSGREDEALPSLHKAYSANPSGSNAMSLGVGYMWARQYADAASHFKNYCVLAQHHKPPMDSDGEYAFEGMAYWYLGDLPGAITTWKMGLEAPYSVAGVPVKLPILLHHASVLQPHLFSKEDAENLLDNRIAKPWRTGWPLPLARYIRHRITKAELEAAWKEPLSPNGLGILSQFEWQVDLYRWECEFHEAFVRLDGGSDSISTFRTKMRSLIDTSLPRWEGERKFASLISRPEFYLARCEAERTD